MRKNLPLALVAILTLAALCWSQALDLTASILRLSQGGAYAFFLESIAGALHIQNAGGVDALIVYPNGPAMPSYSASALSTLTPNTTGQLVYDSSGSSQSGLAISTGVSQGAWVLVVSTTTPAK